MRLWIVLLKKEICPRFAALAFPRTNFADFSKYDFISVSPIECGFFCVAISSATSNDAWITAACS